MTRICIVSPSHWETDRGGAEYRADRLARFMVSHGSNEVSYIARYAKEISEYKVLSLRETRDRPAMRWGFSADMVALYRMLARARPEVVLQFVASAYTGVAAAYCRRHQIPMVWFLASDSDLDITPNVGINGPARILDRALFKFGARRANYIVTQSKWQSERLRKLYRREAAACIYSFHDACMRPLEKRIPFTVLWVGNLKGIKQPELFVELARKLRGSGIAFKIIGRQDESDLCKRIMQDVATVEGLTYLGEMTMEDVNSELESAHLLINTSRFEGFPNTLIQAWLREVPTLTLGVDPDGIITRHQIGRVASNLSELVESVVEFQGNERLLADTGRRARQFAEAECSMRNAECISSLISDVTAMKETAVVSDPLD